MSERSEVDYRLAFLHSPWPTLLAQPQTRQLLDLNLAWRDFSFFEAELPTPLNDWLQLVLPTKSVPGERLTLPAKVRQQQQWVSYDCHVQCLHSELLAISFQLQADLAPTSDMPYAQLQEQIQRKSDLIANASHELRTPLTAILGWPEILLDAQGMPSLAREAAEAIRKDGVFLSRLLEDLIDLSKIEAGYFKLNCEREDLTDLIGNALDTLRHKAAQKSLSLHWSPPQEPVWIQADALRMTQVLWNYLSNAIKYTPQGGQIKLTLELHPEQVIVAICDTGIGMNSSFRQQAFERFTRAEEVSVFDGAGIGLSLVENLVRLHGGRCWVDSELGVGSCFYFSLPRLLLPIATEAPSAPQTLRVLLIAPEAEQAVLQEMLLPTVTQLETLNSLPTARTLSHQLDLLIVVTDLASPQQHQWLQEWRILGSKAPRVLAISASAMPDCEQGLQLGYDAVLYKPFGQQDLIQCMQKILTGTHNV